MWRIPTMWCIPTLLMLLAASAPASAGTFRYEAFVAGARAGDATVTVELDRDRYRLSGFATAGGVVELFSDWRTHFRVAGRISGDAVQLDEYHYLEHDGDKTREVTVRDGTVAYARTGRKPREFAAPEGLDVLTALFVRPDCEENKEVHTGRRRYRLVPLGVADGVCTFSFVDEDDDSVRVDIEFAEREHLILPVRMTVHGFLRGTVRLVE